MIQLAFLLLTCVIQVTVAQSECSSIPIEINSTSGEITSPNFPSNYPNNALCRWKVGFPDDSMSIAYHFASFRMEICAGCKCDYLRIHDGPDSSSPVVGTYCGTSRPQDRVLSSSQMFVEFQSDASYNDTGFQLVFEQLDIACSTVRNLITAPGEFSSPFYPDNNYHKNANCNWRIIAPEGQTVQVAIPDFSTEINRDFLRIYDGPDISPAPVAELSGNHADLRYNSSDSFMYFWFTSDWGNPSHRGFLITFIFSGTVTEPPGSTVTIPVPTGSTSLPTPGPINSPEFELTLNGTFRTEDNSAISSTCLEEYRSHLRDSASIMLQEINVLFAEEVLCHNLSTVYMPTYDLSLSTIKEYGYPTLVYKVPGQKHYAFSTVADCGRDVGVHLEDHNNWAQPIIGIPVECPAVVWEPEAFGGGNYKWSC